MGKHRKIPHQAEWGIEPKSNEKKRSSLQKHLDVGGMVALLLEE